MKIEEMYQYFEITEENKAKFNSWAQEKEEVKVKVRITDNTKTEEQDEVLN